MERDVTKERPGDDVRRIAVGAVAVLLAVCGVTVVFALLADLAGVPFDYLSRDTSAVLEGPFYAGAYANLTILVWAMAAGVALLSASVLRRGGQGKAALMTAAAGAITTIMVIDDLFLVHESLATYLHIPEKAGPIGYAILVVGFSWYFRRLLRTDALLSITALGCWGVSALLDNVLYLYSDFAVEDGTKLAGVGIWTFMVMRVASRSLLALREPVADEDRTLLVAAEGDEAPDDVGDLGLSAADAAAARAVDAGDEPAPAPRSRPAWPREPHPVGAMPVAAPPDAAWSDDAATTPVHVVAAPAHHGPATPARNQATDRDPTDRDPTDRDMAESATVATSAVRPRPSRAPAGRPAHTGEHRTAEARNGAARHSGAHARPDTAETHALPVPRNGRPRHRSPDDGT